MRSPPAHHKAIFKHLMRAVLQGFPRSAVTAYSTIGLSDRGGHEIAMAAASSKKSVIKALFDLGATIVEGTRRARAGETFEKLLAHYCSRAESGHVLLSGTPLPGLALDALTLGRRRVRRSCALRQACVL
jgi:hypothetical protein